MKTLRTEYVRFIRRIGLLFGGLCGDSTDLVPRLEVVRRLRGYGCSGTDGIIPSGNSKLYHLLVSRRCVLRYPLERNVGGVENSTLQVVAFRVAGFTTSMLPWDNPTYVVVQQRGLSRITLVKKTRLEFEK